MVRLLRTADHGWYVSMLELSHNHELSKTCGEKKQWNSHSKIDPLTKDFIRKLRENNVSLGRVCSVLGVNSATNGLAVRKQVVRSACATIAQDNIKDDIGKTLRLLEGMKRADPCMVVSFDVDLHGRIKSMLWCSGKNRLDYGLFGDVVTFDTTYKTNLYSMPFGLFVGVNNHFQSVIFGGVLLTHEKIEDFEWAFSKFISIMGGKAPVTVLTDQCQAMGAALKTTIPSARHRWCRWHVLRHAKQKIGSVYSKRSGFKKEFHRLVTYETCKYTFERRWRMLMRKYNLRGNKFVKRLFKKREMWAKPYFMDVFCAGMTSTQRSESANHMLKGYIQRSAPMHLFVSKFNEFQFDRNEAEERENHVTRQLKRKQRVGVPIELHAQEVFTNAMHEKFVDQLFYSGRFIIWERPSDDHFVLVDSRFAGLESPRKVSVRIESDGKLACQCGLFEHMGLLCKHALKVLVHLDRMVIPDANIKSRWSKAHSGAFGDVGSNGSEAGIAEADPYIRKKVVINRLADFVAKQDGLGDFAFLEAMRLLDNLGSSNVQDGAARPDSERIGLGGEDPIPSACPQRPCRAGRLPTCSNNSASKVPLSISAHVLPLSTDEENPPGCKTRGVGELMQL
ncbi:hypothetical protein BS78_02G399300 [Paspalum vaginatum]|nr:hypothetical protein BS78_02G399300 [Paspalum vaginatum]